LRLAIIPAFFGLGVLWSEDAPWAEQVERHLRRWDRDPILQRLEENRLLQLIERLDLDLALDEERGISRD
jgi:hypothetical protein